MTFSGVTVIITRQRRFKKLPLVSENSNVKYVPADLDKVVQTCGHLTDFKKNRLLHALLNEYDHLFDGTLGTWWKEPHNIELKEGAKPYHSRPFPFPKKYTWAHSKSRVGKTHQIGSVKQINASEWAAPTFIISKKDATVRFISDFCELNKRIKRNPFSILKFRLATEPGRVSACSVPQS